MRGEILSFDEGSGTGVIRGEDGQSYSFDRAALATPATIATGLRADFSPVDGTAGQILLMPAAQPVEATSAASASPWAATAASSTATAPTAAGAPGAIDWGSLFVSFNGRLRRSHFWIGVGILVGAFIVANFVPFIGFFIVLALIWPNLAIGVKRLHDMGLTGWLNAIPLAVNIVGMLVGFTMLGMALMAQGFDPQNFDSSDTEALMALFTPETIGPAMGVFAVVLLINLAFVAWIGAVDSQKGDNRYGPNPKGE